MRGEAKRLQEQSNGWTLETYTNTWGRNPPDDFVKQPGLGWKFLFGPDSLWKRIGLKVFLRKLV